MSGASAAADDTPDPKTWVFGELLTWLKSNTGRSEASLRAWLGKCCSQYGEDAVVAAGMLIRAPPVPVDPLSAMKARLESHKVNGHAANPSAKSRPASNLYLGAALALAEREQRAADRGAGDDPSVALLDGR